MDFKENLLQMEASRNRVRGGLWNMPGPRRYSKDTQDMLKCEEMIKEMNVCECEEAESVYLCLFSHLVFSNDAGIQAYPPPEETDH